MDKKIHIAILAFFVPLISWGQLPKSALDYMLQKPPVAKHFEDKVIGDHLFVQVGAGPTFAIGKEGDLASIHSSSLMTEIMIGDWLTPEHGIRLGFEGGSYKLYGDQNKFVGGSLDYLLNITALASHIYPKRKAFELYGIAGLEYLYARKDGDGQCAVGARLGLQGNLALGDCVNLFVEPRIELYEDNLYHMTTWRKYRPAASIQAGLGYNLLTRDNRINTPNDYHDFFDGLFVSSSIGGGMMLRSGISESKNFKGVKAAVSIGKWFNPYWAIRLTANVETFKRHNDSKMKGTGGQIDYMLNLNNIFGGYDPTRIFNMSAIIGYDLNYTIGKAGETLQFSPGVGAGVQANLFLNKQRNFSFFLEPRIDIQGYKYIPGYNSTGKIDATATLLAGFTLYRNPSETSIHKSNLNYKNNNENSYDHLFFETGIGTNSISIVNAITHPRSYWGPAFYAGVGKWFDATSGIKLSTNMSKYRTGDMIWRSYLSGNIDYLWNISNAFIGYRSDRKIEFLASAGLNLAIINDHNNPYLGGNIGAEAIWHINKFFGFFIEPQLKLYNNHFAPGYIRFLKWDGMISMLGGLHFDMNGYNGTQWKGAFSSSDKKAFVSVGGGVAFKPYHPKEKDYYGLTGKIGAGRWFTPLSGWRISASASEWKDDGHRFARASGDIDYLFDLSTFGMGYNPNRLVSFRALAGADLSMDYYKGNIYTTPALHVGGQMGVRMSPTCEVFLEPQISHDLLHTRNDFRSGNVNGSLILGLNYSMAPSSKVHHKRNQNTQNDFITFGYGMGINTETVQTNYYFHRKWTFDMSMTYGHWFNDVSGVRVGLNDEFQQKMGTEKNKQITSLHVDYMINLNAALNEGIATNQTIQFNAMLGASANMGTRGAGTPRFAPGIWGSVQADFNIGNHVCLFLEPSANLMGKNIAIHNIYYHNRYYHIHNQHPFEVGAQLAIGTKFKF